MFCVQLSQIQSFICKYTQQKDASLNYCIFCEIQDGPRKFNLKTIRKVKWFVLMVNLMCVKIHTLQFFLLLSVSIIYLYTRLCITAVHVALSEVAHYKKYLTH